MTVWFQLQLQPKLALRVMDKVYDVAIYSVLRFGLVLAAAKTQKIVWSASNS